MYQLFTIKDTSNEFRFIILTKLQNYLDSDK